MRLTDGSVVPADVVVVGIGVAPATGWLEGSGLELRDGVVCDADARRRAARASTPRATSAAGRNPLFDEEMRVEHWTNAAEQGAHAARSLLAAAAGRPAGNRTRRSRSSGATSTASASSSSVAPARTTRSVLVSGSVEDRGFVALYGQGGRLRGVLGLSRPSSSCRYQKLLAAGATWEDAVAHAAAAG